MFSDNDSKLLLMLAKAVDDQEHWLMDDLAGRFDRPDPVDELIKQLEFALQRARDHQAQKVTD